MKRQVSSFVAVMALSFVALGQEPQDEERVEVKVVGPTGEIQALEPDEMDIEDLGGLEGALGSFILGVQGQTQDADEKGEHKGKKGQDAGKGRTIEREIDLGNGRKMKIIISTEMMKDDGKDGAWTSVRRFAEGGMKTPEGGMPGIRRAIELPEGGDHVRIFRGGEGLRIDPHGFRVEGMGGDVREHMERAMRAFDRAREEFIRAFHEGEPRGEAGENAKKAPIERRVKIAKPSQDHEGRVIIEKRGDGEAKAEAEGGAKAKMRVLDAELGAIKRAIKENAEADEKTEAKTEAKKGIRAGRLGDLKFLGVAPGAAAKQDHEIDELRKEIKALEKMVQDMKDQLQKGK